MITKELIAEFLKNVPHGVSVPAHIANEINRVRVIRNTVSQVEEELANAKVEYERKKKELYEKKQKARENCKHECRSFNPDPAGGRDSYHTCDICGKELN